MFCDLLVLHGNQSNMNGDFIKNTSAFYCHSLSSIDYFICQKREKMLQPAAADAMFCCAVYI